jgi:Gas vesicle synthesis protein GvpL/GvpF
MSLLVYGIVEADGADPLGLGLDGRRLRGVAEGPLAAVISDHHDADPEPTATALHAYERTVRQLMERGAILPAQFGSVLGDEAAVRGLLRRRRKDLLTRLRRISGAVEIGLRANWRGGGRVLPDVRPQSGASYLRDRLELRQGARRVASELDPLTALARSSRRALAPRPDLPVLDAYLVDRRRVEEFVALVEQLDDRLDDVELVCTGPWPPYSFAEGAPV